MEALKAKILEEYENGNVVIKTPFGVMCAPLENFIAQTADSILYDLNRNEEVSLTLLSDPK